MEIGEVDAVRVLLVECGSELYILRRCFLSILNINIFSAESCDCRSSETVSHVTCKTINLIFKGALHVQQIIAHQKTVY